ncbi:MAG TPA: nitroreductase family protein [Opitutaceae bacterium]|nr:nitroreductase family protein [Opitutaceae bacterium]
MTTETAAIDFSRHISVLPPRTGRDPKSFHRALLERRATAHFSATPVPVEDITSILAAGGQAPSGYNLQPWRFLVLRNPKRRQALRKAAFDQPKITEAPVVIVAFAPHAGWEETAGAVFAEGAARGAIPPENPAGQARDAVEFVRKQNLAAWLNRHVMIAFTHMMLAAEVLGWDTAPMEGFDPEQVRAQLGFPADTEIVALLAIGQMAGKDRPYPGRLSLSQIAFAEDLAHHWPDTANGNSSGENQNG